MAPSISGSTKLSIEAPLNSATPLKLSAAGITFDAASEQVLSGPETTFNVESMGTSVASGTEALMDLHLGTVLSASKPIGVKVMKARTLNVTIYKIARIVNPNITQHPDLVPTAQAITKHLNRIFEPQINVTFNVNMVDAEIAVPWDISGEGYLNSAPPDQHSNEQQLILNEVNNLPAPNPAPNITVMLIGSGKKIDTQGSSLGLTNRNLHTCWVLGSSIVGYRNEQDVLDTLGHEVGHVLVGYGHPSEDPGEEKGLVPLPGTKHSLRLMCKGKVSTTSSKILVKGEWDEADRWIKGEIANGRLAP